MTRFMLLERGEELSDANCGELSAAPSPIRLRLLEPAPPFREGEILQVSARVPQARRPFLLCRAGGVFFLRRGGEVNQCEEALGSVVALERGPETFSLDRGVLARVPARWLARAIDAFEVLGRFRHPFTPSLYLGSPEACLAVTGLDPVERETVARHVKPGGRLLDIGCGAGREALGFARMAFRVTAIDIAPRMIEAARLNAEREGLEVAFKVQSATELEAPPGSFDGAYWAGSYHHVPGRALRIQTLRRIVRTLSPDGVLILMVVYRELGLISRSRLVDLLRKVGRRLPGTHRVSEPGDRHMREVSNASDPRTGCFFHDFAGPREVGAELEAAGLTAEEVAQGWWACRRAVLPG
jgi:SAM-dependent methyltransferase